MGKHHKITVWKNDAESFQKKKNIMDIVRTEREIPKVIGKLKTDLGLSDPRRVNSRTEKNISNRNYVENAKAMVGWLQF